MNTYDQVMNAKLDSSKVSKKLEAERRLIEFKTNYKTKDIELWEGMMRSLSDFAMDRGAVEIGRNIREIKDPASYLRAFAFHMKLGLFALDQVLVQASQVVNITSIAGTTGVRGIANLTPLRMALFTENDAIISTIAKRASNVTGIPEDQFVDMVRWIKESGRGIVDDNLIELSGNTTLARNGLSKLISAGRAPFNEGERIARINGASVAYLEYVKKFPNGDPFSDAGKSWILNRQDLLTAHMTNASAGPAQRGLFAIPTQFLTYHFRMLEQVMLGSLTGWEKVRLMSAMGLMYGGAGLGYGSILDRQAYEGDLGIDPEVYTALRYGLTDMALSLSGSETALSSRIGVGEGFTDLIEKMVEGKFFEVLSGPSGPIVVDTVSATANLAYNMFSKDFKTVEYDWHKLGRNITTYNRAYNAWIASQHGEYLRRRDGAATLTGLNQADAFMMGLGIPLKQNEVSFSVFNLEKDNKEHLKKTSEKMKELRRIMMDYIDKEDWTSAQSISEDIGALYQILSPANKEDILRYMNEEEDYFWTVMVKNQKRRPNSTLTGVTDFMAERIQNE